MLAQLSVVPELHSHIVESQQSDAELLKLLKKSYFPQGTDGAILFKGQLCIPNDVTVNDRIMVVAYKSKFSIHLSSTKMYQDMKRSY